MQTERKKQPSWIIAQGSELTSSPRPLQYQTSREGCAEAAGNLHHFYHFPKPNKM